MTARGEVVNLSASFYDAGDLVDPPAVTLTIRLNGTVVHGPVQYPGPVTRAGVGLFTYAWAVPLDAALGTYVAEWSAVLIGGDPPSVGYETFPVTADGLTVTTGNLYCSLADARNVGAVGSDTMVEAAIREAMDRADRFTDDLFSPRTLTVTALVQPDGRAFLPYRVTSPEGITTVEDADADVTYSAAAWRAYSSATPGDVDSIGIGASYVGSNILVNGLEPWNRSYRGQGRVRVTGQFGWATTPSGVRWATAHLAAIISASMRPDDDNNPATPTPETAATVDPEGNVIPVVPPFSQEGDQVEYDPSVAQRTTGSRRADALLIPYRNTPVLLGV
jgi:hypothetical protein